ncbi:MAG: AEC family transporter [Planctomycetes bacterium]|nr:AEC family transporter [Planctomycetota bacterium]
MTAHLVALLCVIAPVFALILLGTGLKRARLIGDAGAGDLHRLVYWVGLPAQLVVAIGSSDVRAYADARGIGICLAAYWIVFVASWFATTRLTPEVRGSVLSGVVRGNGAFIGLPVILLFAATLPLAGGERVTGIYVVLLGIMVPCFNLGAMLGFLLPRHGVSTAGMRAILVECVTNPLLIACAIGVVISLTRVGLFTTTEPILSAFASTLTMLGASSVPLALLLVGYQLDLTRARDHAGLIGATAAVKLLVLPALVYALGKLAGVDDAALIAAVVLMAAPTATASVPMAAILGGDVALMASIIAVTTVGAIAGMLFWLMVLTG